MTDRARETRRPVLAATSDVQATQQRKNAQQRREEEQRNTPLHELPASEQYGRIVENVGSGLEGVVERGRAQGDVPGIGPSLPQAVAEFAPGQEAGDRRSGTQFGRVYQPQAPTSGDEGEQLPESIVDQVETERFAARTQQQMQHVASNFKLFETLYAEGNLSPQAQAALDEAYDQSVIEVESINDEINNKLAQLQSGQELLGVDPETGQVRPADVNSAGLVPGVGGQAAREGTQGAQTPEQGAIGGVFERATARALETQPNVQGQSGPFTFVRGGAESDAHRQMQEDQIREFIGEADNIAAAGAGGQDVSGRTNSLANKAAQLELDALGIQDQGARMDMQLAFEQQIRQDIDNLVQQRQDITGQFEDVEAALAEEDVAQASQKFNLAFDPTPEGAYLDAFETRMDEFLTQSGFEETVPGEYDAVMDVATQIGQLTDSDVALLENLSATEGDLTPAQVDEMAGDVDPETVQALSQMEAAINQVANRFGLDPTALKNEAIRARATASKVFQDIQNVGDAKKVTPGSHAAAYAIFQEAAPRLGEEGAQHLANSPALHQLISVASGGRVGQEKGGNLAGLGGLSKDTYEAMGINYDEIKGDPQAEMGALIDYLIVAYGGDPVAALQDYKNEKVWGRVPGERSQSPMTQANEALAARREQ